MPVPSNNDLPIISASSIPQPLNKKSRKSHASVLLKRKHSQIIDVDNSDNNDIIITPKLNKNRKRAFINKMSAANRTRLGRAFAHRLFLIKQEHNPSEDHTYTILGNSGNVYKVTIGELPQCNCPDASRGNHCKHLFFVLIKVLKIEKSSYLIYQNALLPEELEHIYSETPDVANDVLASSTIRDHYASITGEKPLPKEVEIIESENIVEEISANGTKRKSYENEECPICCEEMNNTEKITWCKNSCGKNFHEACIGKMISHAVSTHSQAKCPMCRGILPKESDTSAVNKAVSYNLYTNEEYVNLSSVSAVHRDYDPEEIYGDSWRWRRNNY